MHRTSETYSLTDFTPKLGEIVLYSPVKPNSETTAPWPAIVHYIVDAKKGLVDLTVFLDSGPKVVKDVPFNLHKKQGHWSR